MFVYLFIHKGDKIIIIIMVDDITDSHVFHNLKVESQVIVIVVLRDHQYYKYRLHANICCNMNSKLAACLRYMCCNRTENFAIQIRSATGLETILYPYMDCFLQSCCNHSCIPSCIFAAKIAAICCSLSPKLHYMNTKKRLAHNTHAFL